MRWILKGIRVVVPDGALVNDAGEYLLTDNGEYIIAG